MRVFRDPQTSAAAPPPIVVSMDLKRRIPLLRWSFPRMAAGARNLTKTGQIGDGREAAAVDYVLNNARAGDIDDVLATIDKFAYEKSMLINVGDEKGQLLDAALRRANPRWSWSSVPTSATARCGSPDPHPPPRCTPSNSPRPSRQRSPNLGARRGRGSRDLCRRHPQRRRADPGRAR